MAVLDALTAQRARIAVRVLSRRARVKAAYVFGSRASGKPGPESDIDVAAFVEGLADWDIRRRARASAQTQREVGDDLELHLFPAESLDNPPTASFAAYILKTGILIIDGE